MVYQVKMPKEIDSFNNLATLTLKISSASSLDQVDAPFP